MTYSYSLPAQPVDQIRRRVVDAITVLPAGPGQDEALAHRDAVVAAAEHLAPTLPAPLPQSGPMQVSVSGHGDANTASVHVSVYRPAVVTSPS